MKIESDEQYEEACDYLEELERRQHKTRKDTEKIRELYYALTEYEKRISNESKQ